MDPSDPVTRSLFDSTEVLRVAPRHLDDLRPNLDEFAAPLLPTASAPSQRLTAIW
jgi:hypothetical protein